MPRTPMDVIDIDGGDWQAKDDFYESYLAAVGAPAWHGRNLDALWDSLTGGHINERGLPLLVRISGATRMSGGARQVVKEFAQLVHEAAREGYAVRIEIAP